LFHLLVYSLLRPVRHEQHHIPKTVTDLVHCIKFCLQEPLCLQRRQRT